ncbi:MULTISPECIES: hypothetical protein [unclassified Sphingobacterium]|uniref:hypothetical protein n=1 Tax=unclassified Sphingobacterium TaxID=2609468 RepID=UPI0025E6CE84|nr:MULTISPECIES: hypothetical protein [unclassified Sphingobacterium]
MKFILISTLLLALFFSTGCSKDNDNHIPEEVLVEKISGTIPKTIDLNGRKIEDWLISYGNYNYNTQLIGSEVMGTAIGTGYNNLYRASILFAPKDWRNELGEIPLVKSLPPSKPNFKNQNTLDSILWADILYANYDGEKVSEINGLEFSHANALWDFHLDGFPEGTTIKLTQLAKGEFLPYKKGDGKFQYVMMGNWWTPDHSKQYILAYVENEIYKIELDMNKKNTIYRFELHFDKLTKTLVIKELKEAVWSDEPWPEDSEISKNL